MTPIFKKGSISVPGNYRPVSLTCGMGKILERCVRNEIDAHIEKNGLMSKSQHGFRSGRSTQTNLLEFFNQTTQWHDTGRCFDVVYLDFSKAADLGGRSRRLGRSRPPTRAVKAADSGGQSRRLGRSKPPLGLSRHCKLTLILTGGPIRPPTSCLC